MNQPFVTSRSLADLHLWEKLEARQAPISFELEVTARCNYDCRHCFINLPAGDRKAKSRELSLQEIKDITGQATSLGAVWCLVTGGEPLLREDFFEIYLALKRLGLLVSVFTNASLITPEHIALFQKYPPRDLEVTVYGVTPETFTRVTRRPGAYASFHQGLDLLLQAGIKVRLKAMALRANVHEFQEIASFCRERTKDYFRFDPFLALRYDGNASRNEEIRAQRLSPEEIVALEQADPERSAALQKECERLPVPTCGQAGCDYLFHCGAGLGSFTVSCEGVFRLCSPLWHADCTCDLRRDSLVHAWNHLRTQVRQKRSQNREFLDKCRACILINLCMWCPATAYLESGQLDAWVEYFCRVAHARASALGDA